MEVDIRQLHLPLTGSLRSSYIYDCCGLCGGRMHQIHDCKTSLFLQQRWFLDVLQKWYMQRPLLLSTFCNEPWYTRGGIERLHKQDKFCVSRSVSNILNQIGSVAPGCLSRMRQLHVKFRQISRYNLNRRIERDDVHDEPNPQENHKCWENIHSLVLEIHTCFEIHNLDIEFLLEALGTRICLGLSIVGGRIFPQSRWSRQKRVLEKFCNIPSRYCFQNFTVSVGKENLPRSWFLSVLFDWKVDNSDGLWQDVEEKQVEVFRTGVELDIDQLFP